MVVGSNPLDDTWHVFEVLRLSWLTYYDARFPTLRAEYAEMDKAFQAAQEVFESAERGNAGDIDATRSDRATTWENRDRVFGKIARLVPVGRVHILTADLGMDERYQSVVAQRLLNDLSTEGQAHPLVTTGFADVAEVLALAIKAVSAQLGMVGRELAWERVSNAMAIVPSEIWLDSARTPDELAAARAQSSDSGS